MKTDDLSLLYKKMSMVNFKMKVVILPQEAKIRSLWCPKTE